MINRLAALGSLPEWEVDEEQQSLTDDETNAYHPLINKDATKQRSAGGTTDLSSSYDPTLSIMSHFFEDVEVVKSDIHFIIDATNQIQDLNDKLLNTTSEDEEKELGFHLRVIINQVR